MSTSSADSRRSLLLVEDEPFLRETLQQLLEHAGYQTHVAENGKDALRVLSTESVDLIISDVRMPQMSGVELLKAVKMQRPFQKLVFFSAFPDLSVEQAKEMGALDLIPKPIRIEQLIEKIEGFLH